MREQYRLPVPFIWIDLNAIGEFTKPLELPFMKNVSKLQPIFIAEVCHSQSQQTRSIMPTADTAIDIWRACVTCVTRAFAVCKQNQIIFIRVIIHSPNQLNY